MLANRTLEGHRWKGKREAATKLGQGQARLQETNLASGHSVLAGLFTSNRSDFREERPCVGTRMCTCTWKEKQVKWVCTPTQDLARLPWTHHEGVPW